LQPETQDHELANALIESFDGLVGLLYTTATGASGLGAETRQEAALDLADSTDERARRIPAWSGTPLDVRRSHRAVREGLGLVASVARDLGEGVIDQDSAANTLFEVVEHLSLLVDLRWLASSASPDVRALLPVTVDLIGELCMLDAEELEPEPDAFEPAPERLGAAPTLTMLLDEDSPADARQALDSLRAAGVPFSVLETGNDGRTRETLWIPGMRAPLHRRVMPVQEGTPRPVLTWEEHVALIAIADQGIPYSDLVTAYLRTGLQDVSGDPDVEALSRAAEAIDKAA
jgi:hypothetical protein